MSPTNSANLVKQLLIDILSLDVEITDLTDETPLLGNFPEFDSMAIVSVLTGLEEQFGFAVDDDELDAEVFATVGNLIEFVEKRR